MTPASATPPRPLVAVDPLVEDAARRAFDSLAERWYREPTADTAGRAALREALLDAVVQWGFADALPGPGDRDAWPNAAVIIRAQARAAAPVDMALLLATGERAAAIADDVGASRSATAPRHASGTCAAAALALGRCLQISAAMETGLALTLQYVQDRRQFGRPLAAFQAIQHNLAVAAEEVAAATVATDLALACMSAEGCPSERLAALLDAAAVVSGQSVDVVYEATHQAHGAIGFTREYALHRHSLNLLRWRDDLFRLLGGELRCAERLGDVALRADGVWRAVTSLMNSGSNP